jgi:acetyl esterase/lipase
VITSSGGSETWAAAAALARMSARALKGRGLGIWDRATNILAWTSILGDRAGTDDVAPYCAPARATKLTGLPPTFMAVAELDVFRDEDLSCATRLQASGVPVELHLYPGV